jgi:hypothetical protein
MKRDPDTTRMILLEAQGLFKKATDHGGDAATACNFIGNGLLKLTEAITDMQSDIAAMRTATSQRDKG